MLPAPGANQAYVPRKGLEQKEPRQPPGAQAVLQMAARGQASPAVARSSESNQNSTRSGVGASDPANPWLHAYHDPVANLQSFSSCIALADLDADGDSKLLVATADRKLKVYKGTRVISEHVLLDQPVAICSFFADDHRPRCPAVAVASGTYIFIYRNLRPYFKFTLPLVEVNPEELAVWRDLGAGTLTPADGHARLAEIREGAGEAGAGGAGAAGGAEGGAELTTRTRDFLSQDDPEAQAAFVGKYGKQRLAQQTCVTCMDTLKKALDEDDAISSLVVGTENKEVGRMGVGLPCGVGGVRWGEVEVGMGRDGAGWGGR